MAHNDADNAGGQREAAGGWAQRIGLPGIGALTLGALAICVASGVVVATGFEPARPVQSILGFELGRPYGWFFRALHAWSAHLSLIGLTLHTAEYVARGADRQTSLGTWAAVCTTLPVTAYLMLSGRAVVGDTEAGGVTSVMHGLLSAVPWMGKWLADVFVGSSPTGDPHVLFVHHVATATFLLMVTTVIHLRRIVPDAVATGLALGVAGSVALFFRPALSVSSSPSSLKGPWFMGGLRLLLEHAPAWAVGLFLPFVSWLLLTCLPLFGGVRALAARWVLASIAGVYALLTVVAGWS